MMAYEQAHIRPVVYAFGDLLFKAGDIASAVFLIRAGQVLLESTKGPHIPSVTLASGDLCGECAWDHPPIHKVTATVIQETEAWLFSLEELYALLKAGQPAITRAVLDAKARQAAWRRMVMS